MAALERTGDWRRAAALVENLRREAVTARTMALRRWATAAEAKAKGHISKQDLFWQPLSPLYLNRKIREGYSEKILTRTSTYFQQITGWNTDDTAYAGVKREATEADGTPTANIAAVLEYGSTVAGIPARPLWRLVLREMVWEVELKPEYFNPANIFQQRLRGY